MWNQIVMIICLSVFLCHANTDLIDAEPRIFENRILDIINGVRLRMCYSNPGFLPQLEPFLIEDRFDLKLEDGPTRLNAFVQNVKVEGLSKFLVDYLSFTITLKINITIAVPKLVITGDYGLDANIAGFLKIAGEGPFRIELDGIQLKAVAAFVYIESMMLKELQLEPKLSAVRADIENLTADKYATQFFNYVVSVALPEIVNEHIPPETIESVQQDLEELASSRLAKLTVSDFLDIITGKVSLLPPLDPERACKNVDSQIV